MVSGKVRENGRNRGLQRRRQLYSGAFLLPGLLGVAVFYLLPYITVYQYSMETNPVQREFAGMENYRALFSNQAFLKASANTLQFSALSVLLLVPLALALACLLDFRWKGNRLVRICLLSPMAVPAACIVMIWRVLFDRYGTVNRLLSLVGAEPLDWLRSDWGKVPLLLLFLWKYAGYLMILFLGALANIPAEQVEAARLEGAGDAAVFFRVKLRYLSPALFFAVLISLMKSFQIFREVYLLTGNYPHESLYLLSHFLNNTLRNMDYQKMSAAAIVVSAVIIAVIGILFLLEKWAGRDVEL